MGEFCFGYSKFDYLLDFQGEMLSRWMYKEVQSPVGDVQDGCNDRYYRKQEVALKYYLCFLEMDNLIV